MTGKHTNAAPPWRIARASDRKVESCLRMKKGEVTAPCRSGFDTRSE
jgi:hypothetical protein